MKHNNKLKKYLFDMKFYSQRNSKRNIFASPNKNHSKDSKKVVLSPFPISQLLTFEKFRSRYTRDKGTPLSMSTSPETTAIPNSDKSHHPNFSVQILNGKKKSFRQELKLKKETKLPIVLVKRPKLSLSKLFQTTVSTRTNSNQNTYGNSQANHIEKTEYLQLSYSFYERKKKSFYSSLDKTVKSKTEEIQDGNNDCKKSIIEKVSERINENLRSVLKNNDTTSLYNNGMYWMYYHELPSYVKDAQLDTIPLVFSFQETHELSGLPRQVIPYLTETYFDLRDDMLNYVKEQFKVTFRKKNTYSRPGVYQSRTNVTDTNNLFLRVMQTEQNFEIENHFYINSLSVRAWRNLCELNDDNELTHRRVFKKCSTKRTKRKKLLFKKSTTILSLLNCEKKINILKSNKDIYSQTGHDPNLQLLLAKMKAKNTTATTSDMLKRRLYSQLFNIKDFAINHPVNYVNFPKIPTDKMNELTILIRNEDEEHFKYVFNSLVNHYNIDTINLKGNTLLNLAVQNNLTETAKLILDNGADPNIGNCFNNTPLHYAVSHKNYNVINHLIKMGANEGIANNQGLTPWNCMNKALQK